MIIIFKILILLILGSIAYQDIKDRLVWWFLYPLLGLVGGYLFFEQTYSLIYFYSIGINLVITLGVLSLIWLYVKYFIKKPFFSEAFGLGDVLLLFAFSITFPTLSYLVILFFSVCFSMIIHLVLGLVRKTKTVPLAGYISIFLIGVYSVSWTGIYKSIYLV